MKKKKKKSNNSMNLNTNKTEKKRKIESTKWKRKSILKKWKSNKCFETEEEETFKHQFCSFFLLFNFTAKKKSVSFHFPCTTAHCASHIIYLFFLFECVISYFCVCWSWCWCCCYWKTNPSKNHYSAFISSAEILNLCVFDFYLYLELRTEISESSSYSVFVDVVHWFQSIEVKLSLNKCVNK